MLSALRRSDTENRHTSMEILLVSNINESDTYTEILSKEIRLQDAILPYHRSDPSRIRRGSSKNEMRQPAIQVESIHHHLTS
ncbi:hypothetical protein Tco_0393753 [Tanacetum coccineum]